jgi:hypothetical protein
VIVFLLLAVVLAKFYVPAPAGEFDAPRQTQTQQEPAPSADQPAPADDLGETIGDANSGTDINSP